MERQRTVSILDIAVIVLILVVAILLRTQLSYRTAFYDEAYNVYGGWQLLHGQETYAMLSHIGWQYLSLLPLGLADSVGGLEAARALNAIWGVLTVLVVMMTARRVYGVLAGHIAGAIFAVFGPAIFISTFATHDSLSVLLASLAIYLWVVALSTDRGYLYALGSLAMTAAVLTKYAAVMVALFCLAYGVIVAIKAMTTVMSSDSDSVTIRLSKGISINLVLALAPFVLLPLYAFIYRDQLIQLWQDQVIIKRSLDPNIGWEILKSFIGYLWLPFLLGLLALDWRKKRFYSFGFLVVGLSMMAYQWMNQDNTTLFKHTCYMLLGFAPLAAGGVVMTIQSLAGARLTRARLSIAISVLGLVVVGYLGVKGQQMLPTLRGYWSDTTETMQYLRDNVQTGDVILMEQGVIARYYLIAKGTPGRMPERVWDTWWYQDEEGQGSDVSLYERAVAQDRFDYIVFDYMMTGDLNNQLLETMQGRYELVATFPAFTNWDNRVDVFKGID